MVAPAATDAGAVPTTSAAEALDVPETVTKATCGMVI